MPTILERARSLTTLYVHMCGQTEVPTQFNFWAMLSLIAALVEDRVWYVKHRGMKLAPNMYVFLYGPAAVGKGIAISQAFRMYGECNGVGKVWHGSLTREGMIDVLAGRDVGERGEPVQVIAQPKVWLVTDELGDDIGRGKVANDFVKFMTKLYTSTGMQVDTGTRTHGRVTIVDPLVNWLAGTTEEWMFESLDRNIVGAGFPSRVAFVGADYNPRLRLPRPKYPEDYEQVKEHILVRLWLLQRLEGEFKMTDEAMRIESQWYTNRPCPEDKDLIPSWRREQDFILKLAMLLVLAEGGIPLIIDARHFTSAQKLSRSVQINVPQVVERANETPEIALSRRVHDALETFAIKTHGGYTEYRAIYERLRKAGVSARMLKVELDRLWQSEQVERLYHEQSKKVYWRLRQGC